MIAYSKNKAKADLSGVRRFPVVSVLAVMSAGVVVLGICVRVALLLFFPDDFRGGTGVLLLTFLRGLINDIAALPFMLLLPALLLLPGDRLYTRRSGQRYVTIVLFLFLGVMVLTSFCEVFFWDEFHSRFNFIAVDYLIYTSEVIGNIWESYPMIWLLTAVFSISVALTVLLRRFAGIGKTGVVPLSLLRRMGVFGAIAFAAVMVFFVFSPQTGTGDRSWQEARRNGIYELFSAFRNNTLDYRTFYPVMDTAEAIRIAKEEMTERNATFVAAFPGDLRRDIQAQGPELRPNVIMVVMESLGNKWLNAEDSPNLMRLSQEGLFLSGMQSTGTRTVRGLEALTLGLPPTPGNSIVRRPDNSSLFSIGTVFREKGYDRAFIYGGYGYFDNMNAYFSGNGYRTIDRTDFTSGQKTFANAWGQCDEDLYAASLDQADKIYAAGQPFHQLVLTTSNHRPFTYPEGKIPIPAGEGRKGAVLYADYAIGQFMAQAARKPWFDNTIFIFVGDHPSSIAGKAYLPADGYGVPCVFYAPHLLESETIATLCSQIDVGPTLFRLMGWQYRSQFFGRNVLTMRPEEGRAWISTYQLLGFLDRTGVAVMSPGMSTVPTASGQAPSTVEEEQRLRRAIASYQSASDLFMSGGLREEAVAAGTSVR